MFIARHGIENVGFLTLTFHWNVVCRVEAQRRFNNIARRCLKRYSEWICVPERQERGAWHYHLIVNVGKDIRTSATGSATPDFEAFKQRDYRSANLTLRNEWAFWRRAGPEYGFGRCELTPCKKGPEQIAAYMGKYVKKHVTKRRKEDKGARLVRYSKGASKCCVRFSWRTPGADNWRRKLAWMAEQLGYTAENYQEGFKTDFGVNWGWKLRQAFGEIRFADYPTGKHYLKDWPEDDMGVSADKIETLVDVKLHSKEKEVRQRQAVALLVALNNRKADKYAEVQILRKRANRENADEGHVSAVGGQSRGVPRMRLDDHPSDWIRRLQKANLPLLSEQDIVDILATFPSWHSD